MNDHAGTFNQLNLGFFEEPAPVQVAAPVIRRRLSRRQLQEKKAGDDPRQLKLFPEEGSGIAGVDDNDMAYRRQQFGYGRDD